MPGTASPPHPGASAWCKKKGPPGAATSSRGKEEKIGGAYAHAERTFHSPYIVTDLTGDVKRKDITMNTTAQSWEERVAAYIAKVESANDTAFKGLIAEGYNLLTDANKAKFEAFVKNLLAEQEAEKQQSSHTEKEEQR